jgi:SAM-dependent methyltransferase
MDSGPVAPENWKGERMYWDLASKDDRQLHLSRYAFARDTFEPEWKCLDAACGSGYGTAFLADKLQWVEGIDIDPHAIGYSLATYKKHNLNYRCADLQLMLPFEDAMFDCITSFETLEHVCNQTTMISEFHRVLKPGGILIISTPDREMSERLGLDNHFHVAELSKTEFVRLLSRSFVVEGIYGQGNGARVAPHWRAIHQLLRLGTRVVGMNARARIEAAFARSFGRLRTHFYQMSSTPIQTVTPTGDVEFVYMIAMARKSRSGEC